MPTDDHVEVHFEADATGLHRALARWSIAPWQKAVLEELLRPPTFAEWQQSRGITPWTVVHERRRLHRVGMAAAGAGLVFAGLASSFASAVRAAQDFTRRMQEMRSPHFPTRGRRADLIIIDDPAPDAPVYAEIAAGTDLSGQLREAGIDLDGLPEMVVRPELPDNVVIFGEFFGRNQWLRQEYEQRPTPTGDLRRSITSAMHRVMADAGVPAHLLDRPDDDGFHWHDAADTAEDEGCWADVWFPVPGPEDEDGYYDDCGMGGTDDMGLCARHAAELRSIRADP